MFEKEKLSVYLISVKIYILNLIDKDTIYSFHAYIEWWVTVIGWFENMKK